MRLSKFYDIDFSFSNLGYDLKIFLISFLCGASVFTAEYFFCLLFNSTFAVMGVQADEIRDVVLANFKSTIILSQLKIILVYIVIGGLVGLCFGYILNLYSIIFKKSFRMLSVILSVLFLCFIASLLFLIIDIFYHPALYNEVFYANVGVLRDIQLYITDRISKFVISFIRYITILIFSPLLIAAIFSIIKRIYKVFALLPLYGRIISAVIVLALTFLLAFSDTGKNQGPNIIILSSDSFRYDRISAYGYKRDITPNIDRLVSEGFSFNNLHAQLPRTFPSWYCLLTGKYPKGHGIRHMFPTREELKACKTDLVEILRNKGYTTSVVADYAGDIFSRMDDYERVNTPYFNFDSMIKQRSLELQFMLLPYIQNRLGRYIFPELRCFAQNSDPEYLKNDVIQELGYLSKKKRFFLTVFFSVTHFPYASPYPYYKMYTENEYKGEYKYLKINDPRSAKVITKEDRRYINALFDGACKSLDDAVGQIIDDLKNKGLYDNSIIIIKSDHGENLYDYGLDIGHGEHFRGEFATHIPLIIKFHKNYAANVKTKNYDGIVEQVDFLPTMLDILGIDSNKHMDGVSFRHVIEGKIKRIEKTAYSESGIWFVDKGEQFFQDQRIKYPDVSKICMIDDRNNEIVLKDEYRELINIAKHRTVFDENYKLIYIPTRDGVKFELYQIGDNSFTNLYHRDHPQFKRLYSYLLRFMKKYENAKIMNGIFVP